MEEFALRDIAEDMVKLFRADAAATADQRADKAIGDGDTANFYMWKRIGDIINDLQRRGDTGDKGEQDITWI